jgi:hypothetical protein
LVRDQAKFTAVHPDAGPFIGDFGFNLSGDGELIRLFDPTGAIVFSAFYNDALPWPKEPDGFGPTLELIDATGRMSRWDNWFDGCPLGSPGTAFIPWCWTTGSGSVNALPAKAFRAWGVPSGLVLEWNEATAAEVRVYDAAGRLVLERSVERGRQQWPLRSSGVHVLQVQSPFGWSSKRFWVPGY